MKSEFWDILKSEQLSTKMKMYEQNVLVQVAPNTENPVPNISEELLIALFTPLITSSVGTNSGKCTFWL